MKLLNIKEAIKNKTIYMCKDLEGITGFRVEFAGVKQNLPRLGGLKVLKTLGLYA